MRCVLRFFPIYCGREARHLCPAEDWPRGLRNSCSLATILLSPRCLNCSLPLLHVSLSLLLVVFFLRCFVTDHTPFSRFPPPAGFPFCSSPPCLSVYHLQCFCFCPLLSILSVSWSLSLPSVPHIQRLQCPFAEDLEVKGLRRRGFPSPLIPHPAETLGLWESSKKEKHPKKGVLLLLFLRRKIPEM